ncbi:MAG: acetyl-CoA hydrolase/transferase C-terminal domain-containing protein [Actinomycetota bacterium]|nr:acetyl-CoA hydrolase/transferase C-terminal domain-containing protein [Actinomycetota bacterium]
MNKWEEMYKSKLTTPEDVAAVIKSGEHVFASGASSTPVAILEAIFDRAVAGEFEDVQLGSFIMLANVFKVLQPELQRNLLIDNYYTSPLDRKALADGLMTHTPYHFHRVTKQAVHDSGYRKLMVQVGPMDKQGYLNLGLFANYLDVVNELDGVYVEVNEEQPIVHGPNWLHISQVDKVVENSHPVFALPPDPVTERDHAIAENIIDLIEDGSTVQLGIGGTTNAIGELLVRRKHLGCHTEMIGDAYMNLFEAGALDNTVKSLHPHQMLCHFCLGSQDLYNWLDDNPMVYLSPISYNNDPYLIGRNDNMVSINTTIEIDITGQCASESFGPIQYTATGGQVDFTRGTWLSRGGKAFIITHSVVENKDGELVSKIVPQLRPGAVVTLTRTDVMYVATEYGVVNLRGKSLRQRAQALISIAHPDFRAELSNYAKEVKYFILPEHDPLA